MSASHQPSYQGPLHEPTEVIGCGKISCMITTTKQIKRYPRNSGEGAHLKTTPLFMLLYFVDFPYFHVRCMTVPFSFSSVPRSIGSPGGLYGRFSRNPLPVFSAGGYCEEFCRGQGRPVFHVSHPAFPLLTAESPTLHSALRDGFGEAVVASHMPEACEFPSLGKLPEEVPLGSQGSWFCSTPIRTQLWGTLHRGPRTQFYNYVCFIFKEDHTRRVPLYLKKNYELVTSHQGFICPRYLQCHDNFLISWPSQ